MLNRYHGFCVGECQLEQTENSDLTYWQTFERIPRSSISWDSDFDILAFLKYFHDKQFSKFASNTYTIKFPTKFCQNVWANSTIVDFLGFLAFLKTIIKIYVKYLHGKILSKSSIMSNLKLNHGFWSHPSGILANFSSFNDSSSTFNFFGFRWFWSPRVESRFFVYVYILRSDSSQ